MAVKRTSRARGHARQIVLGRRPAQGRRRQKRRRRHATWPMPSSTTSVPLGREQAPRVGGDRAIAVEPVGAAVERAARIEVAHLRRERRDLAASRHRADWRRRDRRRPPSAAAVVAGDEAARVRKAERAALSRAQRERARALMSVPTPTRAGSSRSSASSSAPEPVPRSAMRSGAPRIRARERRERGLDHGLGLRPRHQRVGRERERQAPELLAAEDARDRLAREPARAPSAAMAAASAGASARSAARGERRRGRGRAHGRRGGAHRARACRGRRRETPARARGAPPRSVSPSAGRAAASPRDALRGQQRGLMLGHQRVDDLAERLALDHLRQLVERQIDAVVGDARPAENCRCGCARSGRRSRPGRGARRRARRRACCARRRRAWRAASPSPWRGSGAASAPPARPRRCRSACG